MKSEKNLFWVLLALLALFLIGYAVYHLTRTEKKVEKEIQVFELKQTEKSEKVTSRLPVLIPLGYGRGQFYSDEIKPKPDIALFYKFDNPLKLNHIGLTGVWLVERDRIRSLSEDGILSIYFEAPRIFVELSGQSTLPVRIELDGHPAGEIWVTDPREYEISLDDHASAHLLTLHVPRGISAYLFRLTEN